ncbi:MAG: carbon-nitrogen hydrolase family protein [bacterium]
MDTFPRFKAAVVQAAPVWLDREATADKACRLIASAAKEGAQLIAFPEAWLPGFPWWIFLGTPAWGNSFFAELYANSVEIPSPTTDRLCRAAKEAGAYLVMGMDERAGGSLYCTQLFIDPDGEIMGRHRKLKPTHVERSVWGEGDGSDLRVFDTPLGKIGGLNCWEHMQPLTRYAMYSLGQQIHVASWPAFSLYRKYAYALGEVTNVGATRHYALEGSCFALMAVSVISKEMVDRLADTAERADLIEVGGGASQIFAPDGSTIAGPPRGDEEAIVTADIDLYEIARAKNFADPTGHYSRPDIFRLLVNRTPQPCVQDVVSFDGAAAGDIAVEADGERCQEAPGETTSPGG